jgi:hypothetical protein
MAQMEVLDSTGPQGQLADDKCMVSTSLRYLTSRLCFLEDIEGAERKGNSRPSVVVAGVWVFLCMVAGWVAGETGPFFFDLLLNTSGCPRTGQNQGSVVVMNVRMRRILYSPGLNLSPSYFVPLVTRIRDQPVWGCMALRVRGERPRTARLCEIISKRFCKESTGGLLSHSLFAIVCSSEHIIDSRDLPHSCQIPPLNLSSPLTPSNEPSTNFSPDSFSFRTCLHPPHRIMHHRS